MLGYWCSGRVLRLRLTYRAALNSTETLRARDTFLAGWQVVSLTLLLAVLTKNLSSYFF
jgi:hypothetical protein